MAQVIDRTVGANPTGFDMRTELNNIIGALESDNSGSSEPLNPVAYMKWLDTSDATYYYYKERNHDNTAWVTLFRYTVATKIMEVVSNGVVLQDSALVHKTGNETIAGVKTFSSTIAGNINGNAETANRLISRGGFPNADGQDFNTLTTTGVYYVQSGNYSGTLNSPGGYGTLFVNNAYPFISQLYISNDDGTIRGRVAYISTWSGWSESDSIGVGQTWQDVTASRASGVTYTNTTGKPIFLLVFSTNGNFSGVLNINGISVNYGFKSDAYYAMQSVQIIVPNNSTYSVTFTDAGIAHKWLELR